MDSDLEGAERQQQLLDSIVDASELGHRMPTYDELATKHQMVKSGVYKILRILINKDYLECERTPSGMSGDNLHTGDDVMVDENARWHDGDMVAVRDRGVTRIKRIWNDASRVVLESSNPDVTPICLEKGKEHVADVIVHGEVVTTICSHIQPGRRSNRSSPV